MPTYLIHGFRWMRQMIRIHIILQNLDDGAPEWIVAPASAITVLNSFYSMFEFLPPSNPPPAAYKLPPAPSASVIVEDEKDGRRMLTGVKGKQVERGKDMRNANGSAGAARKPPTSHPRQLKKTNRSPTFNDWSVVKLLEQYDPEDEKVVSQPYAFVGDHIIEVTLSVSIEEEKAKYEEKMRRDEALIASALESGNTSAASSKPESGGAISSQLSAREVRRKSRKLGWFEKLRDNLEKEAEIGWFVVICGDEERATGLEDRLDDLGVESSEEEQLTRPKTPRSAGLKGFFHRKKSGDGM